MKTKTKVLSAMLAVLVLTTVAISSSGGEFLQGKFATPGVSLPDLIPVPAATTLTLTGEVGVDKAGNVVDYNITFDSKCAIRNVGVVTASGTSYSWCHFLDKDGIILSSPELASLSLRQRTTLPYTATRTDVGDDSGAYDYYALYLDFFQDLYDGGGTMSMDVDHNLDYDSGLFIVESKETNNTISQSITVTDAGIVWTVR